MATGGAAGGADALDWAAAEPADAPILPDHYLCLAGIRLVRRAQAASAAPAPTAAAQLLLTLI